MKRDHYIFDNTRNEFIKVTNSTGRIVGKILKYFAVTASLAIVYYVAFSLVISTDSEKKLKQENQMYKQLYSGMVAKEKVVGDVIQGIEMKDRNIYDEIFKSDVPSMSDFSDQSEFTSDSISENNIVKYSSRKLDVAQMLSQKTEANFKKIADALSDGSRPIPPLTNPIKNFSYRRVGASVGKKINPFFKVAVEHEGMDLLGQQGDSVYTAADGVVSRVARSEKGLGNIVEISHEGGYFTRYAHLDGIKVSKGQKVKKGTLIGTIGMSGNSFAPHLHYEVLKDTVRQEPANYMFASLSADDYVKMLFLSVNTGQSMD